MPILPPPYVERDLQMEIFILRLHFFSGFPNSFQVPQLIPRIHTYAAKPVLELRLWSPAGPHFGQNFFQFLALQFLSSSQTLQTSVFLCVSWWVARVAVLLGGFGRDRQTNM